MKYRLAMRFLAVSCFMIPAAVQALELSGPFSDHMVFQRDKPLPVWGRAEAGRTITVTFGEQSHTTRARDDGSWRVHLAAEPASNTGRTLSVMSGDDVVAVTNVLVGDVWVCSGQSNMEWPLAKASNGPAVIGKASNDTMRLLYMKKEAAAYPRDSVAASWRPVRPESVTSFSAVAYFFGRELQQELSVPIGLIQAAWGGTAIQPWTNPEGWKRVDELSESYTNYIVKMDPRNPVGRDYHLAAYDDIERWVNDARAAVAAGVLPPDMPSPPVPENQGVATALYNGMIHPLIPFAIRGAIWYQGEANAQDELDYRHRMEALIKGWRDKWGQGDFPFYYVQLANFLTTPTNEPAMNSGWGLIREAQRLSLAVTNTGMAVIIDVGDVSDIHPRNKQDVGRRLAALALAGEFGQDRIASGPLYRDVETKGGKLYITFDHVGSGLMAGLKSGLEAPQERPVRDVHWLSVSGRDGVWHWADAEIEGDRLVLSSPAVREPVAARYATVMNPTGALLYNREGFPMSPFATDTE